MLSAQSEGAGMALASKRLPRRAVVALALGFVAVAAGVAALHPQIGAVLASVDDDPAAYWRQERSRTQASAPSAAPAGDARSAQSGQRSAARIAGKPQPPATFGLPGQAALPPLASAYAPAPGAQWPSGLAHPSSSPNPAKAASANRAPARVSSQAVCVRLCDGAFFPAPESGASAQEACARACPRAPTRVYHMTGADISTAVSARDGAPYSALPVAMRYASVRDKTCSCGAADHAAALLNDTTLRRGDRVMTVAGFRVFKGSARPPYSRNDFQTLAQARYLPERERASLRQMERAAGVKPQARERDFLAALQAVPQTTAMP